MTKFLVRLFVKDYKNIENPKVRNAYGKLSGMVGILTNLLLCAMKILIGLASASLSIVSDGINNLTDASSSVITLVGFRLAEKPEDKDHPYGHARYEYLAGLFTSIMIIIVGAFLLRSSVLKVIHPTAMHLTRITFVILAISILLKIWQCFFYTSVGKTIQSLALKAQAADSRNDVITTTVVLIGAVISALTPLNVDGWLSCAVAIFIIVSGIQLALETMSPLLGEAPSEELVEKIQEKVMSYDGILGQHDLIVHNYGPGKVFASIHAEVDAGKDVLQSHDIIDNIEQDVRDSLNIEFVIHMDPILKDDPETHLIRTKLATIGELHEEVINFHDVRIVPGPTHTNVVFDIALQAGTPESLRNVLAEECTALLRKVDPTYILVINFDQNYV